MRPLTDRIPKALLRVNDTPLIVLLIAALVRAEIRELVINVAHLGEQIVAELGDGTAFGVRIEYSREAEALETAGGIAYALPLLGAAPFIAVNADVYSDYDFTGLVAAARGLSTKTTLAHLVLVDNPPQHLCGDFGLVEGYVLADAGVRHTFSGMGAYHPALFDGIARGARARLADRLIAAMESRQVTGELYRGCWQDVGTPERLTALDQALRSTR